MKHVFDQEQKNVSFKIRFSVEISHNNSISFLSCFFGTGNNLSRKELSKIKLSKLNESKFFYDICHFGLNSVSTSLRIGKF